MISIRSADDIYVLNNRVAIIKDVFGTWRVVSLIHTPFRELESEGSGRGFSYMFKLTNDGPDWNQRFYNQPQLGGLVINYGKSPTESQLDQMKRDGAISV